MRIHFVVVALGATLLAGCASSENGSKLTASMVAPKNVSAKQEAADRAACEATAVRTAKADPAVLQEAQQRQKGAELGGLQSGFIGGVLGVVIGEMMHDGVITGAATERANACLARKRYRAST